MNRRLPLTPIEKDAIIYVILSVLLLFSVNQVFSQPSVDSFSASKPTSVLSLSDSSAPALKFFQVCLNNQINRSLVGFATNVFQTIDSDSAVAIASRQRLVNNPTSSSLMRLVRIKRGLACGDQPLPLEMS